MSGFMAMTATQAFARGGPGGAFGSILAELLVIAIVVGLITGFVCAGRSVHTLRKLLGLSMALAIVVSVAIPFLGVFLAIPALVMLAVATAIWYLAQHGLLVPRASTSQESSTASPMLNTGWRTSLLRWIAATYVFWSVVSLINFELLGFLAIPPAALIFPSAIAKFLPFLWPPLAIATVLAVTVTFLSTKNSPTRRHAAPFIFNACLLIAFWLSAEGYRQHLTSQALLGHKPTNLTLSSFTDSVINYRTYFRGAHGSFEENGKTYRWSYAERSFYQIPQK